ncbi:MAG TPA: hypothetical protein VL426_07655 [Candidatus Binatia bacterium]|jgi:hypothetical protein|nr:hypothetical protein [Candidatus Binatia bacterium]
MEIAFHFNMPPQQDKVTVMFGETNDEDAGRQFRVGFRRPGEPDEGAHWSLLGWVQGTDLKRLLELQLEVDRGDTVRIERMDPGGATTFFEVNTGENWPAAAVGTNPILSSWTFED